MNKNANKLIIIIKSANLIRRKNKNVFGRKN